MKKQHALAKINVHKHAAYICVESVHACLLCVVFVFETEYVLFFGKW